MKTRLEKKRTHRFLPSFTESLVAVSKRREGGIEAERFGREELGKRGQSQVDTLPRPLVLRRIKLTPNLLSLHPVCLLSLISRGSIITSNVA